ncbi:MAG: acyl-CoA reductase [Acetivibrionales bacterium]
MQTGPGEIQCLYGSEPFEKMPLLKALKPFSDEAVDFLSALSRELLADKDACAYPDIAAFAYFCRKSSIEKEKAKYSDCLENRIGRGLTFHIAPSNVPTIFAYSMASGLLGGNACIVRVSEKPFPQVDIICNAIKNVFQSGKHDILKEYIAIIRYERSNDITAYFSAMCNVRVIWGGDNTISEIRKYQLPPRAFDITFADRYSFCAIHARNYIEKFNPEKTAQDFYNDVYLYDQNACSSPRLIAWIGSKEDIAKAKKAFLGCNSRLRATAIYS